MAGGTGPARSYVIAAVNPDTLQRRVFPLADANDAVLDDAGKTLYFTRNGLALTNDNVKLYRGGAYAQLWRFAVDSSGEAAQLLAADTSNSKRPMWWQGRLYFISDRGGSDNLWTMAPDGSDPRQLTRHTDWDVRNAAMGDGRIAYQLGADLHVWDVAAGSDATLAAPLVSDFDQQRSRQIRSPLENLTSVRVAGKFERIVLTARGRVSVAGTGVQRRVEIAIPEGARAREAVFSHDDKAVYAIVDTTGENEIWKFAADGSGQGEQLTRDGTNHRWKLYPSPDGRWLGHTDKKGRFWLLDLAHKTNTIIDDAGKSGVGEYEEILWSPDSRNLALVRAGSTEQRDQIGLYNLDTKKLGFVTSDRYTSRAPVFSPDGRWLYFLSARNFTLANGSPWGDRNMGPVFDRRTGIYALALQPDNRFPFKPDDELSKPADKPAEGATEQAAEKAAEKAVENAVVKGAAKGAGKPLPAIAYAGLAERLYEVPLAPGNYQGLQVDDKRLYFIDADGADGKAALKTLAIAGNGPKPEVFAAGVREFDLSADRKHVYYRTLAATGPGDMLVVEAGAKAPADTSKARVKVDDWTFTSNPRLEWRQMFNDAWRMHRDFLYDVKMRGADWPARSGRAALADPSRRHPPRAIGRHAGRPGRAAGAHGRRLSRRAYLRQRTGTARATGPAGAGRRRCAGGRHHHGRQRQAGPGRARYRRPAAEPGRQAGAADGAAQGRHAFGDRAARDDDQAVRAALQRLGAVARAPGGNGLPGAHRLPAPARHGRCRYRLVRARFLRQCQPRRPGDRRAPQQRRQYRQLDHRKAAAQGVGLLGAAGRGAVAQHAEYLPRPHGGAGGRIHVFGRRNVCRRRQGAGTGAAGGQAHGRRGLQYGRRPVADRGRGRDARRGGGQSAARHLPGPGPAAGSGARTAGEKTPRAAGQAVHAAGDPGPECPEVNSGGVRKRTAGAAPAHETARLPYWLARAVAGTRLLAGGDPGIGHRPGDVHPAARVRAVFAAVRRAHRPENARRGGRHRLLPVAARDHAAGGAHRCTSPAPARVVRAAGVCGHDGIAGSAGRRAPGAGAAGRAGAHAGDGAAAVRRRRRRRPYTAGRGQDGARGRGRAHAAAQHHHPVRVAAGRELHPGRADGARRAAHRPARLDGQGADPDKTGRLAAGHRGGVPAGGRSRAQPAQPAAGNAGAARSTQDHGHRLDAAAPRLFRSRSAGQPPRSGAAQGAGRRRPRHRAALRGGVGSGGADGHRAGTGAGLAVAAAVRRSDEPRPGWLALGAAHRRRAGARRPGGDADRAVSGLDRAAGDAHAGAGRTAGRRIGREHALAARAHGGANGDRHGFCGRDRRHRLADRFCAARVARFRSPAIDHRRPAGAGALQRAGARLHDGTGRATWRAGHRHLGRPGGPARSGVDTRVAARGRRRRRHGNERRERELLRTVWRRTHGRTAVPGRAGQGGRSGAGGAQRGGDPRPGIRLAAGGRGAGGAVYRFRRQDRAQARGGHRARPAFPYAARGAARDRLRVVDGRRGAERARHGAGRASRQHGARAVAALLPRCDRAHAARRRYPGGELRGRVAPVGIADRRHRHRAPDRGLWLVRVIGHHRAAPCKGNRAAQAARCAPPGCRHAGDARDGAAVADCRRRRAAIGGAGHPALPGRLRGARAGRLLDAGAVPGAHGDGGAAGDRPPRAHGHAHGAGPCAARVALSQAGEGLELGGAAARHFQLRTVAQRQIEPAGLVGRHAVDEIEVDDVAAAGAKEPLRIEPFLELVQGTQRERPVLVEIHARVIAVRFEQADVVQRDEPASFAILDEQFSVRCGRRRIGSGMADGGRPACQPGQGRRHARRLDRLLQVVERIDFEGLQRVLVEGGRENHLRRVHQGGQHVEAAPARHLHVEEDQVGLERDDLLHAFGRVHRLAHDVHLRVRRQQAAQFGARQALVVDQQYAHLCGLRDGQCGAYPAAMFGQIQVGARTDGQRQALAGISQSHPGGIGERRDGAVIGDFDADRAVIAAVRHDADVAARGAGFHAIFDGVFHQRLQRHRRNAHVFQACADIDADAHALLEADFLDRQVRLHGVDFGGQRHRVVVARLQRVAHHACQLVDHLRCRVLVLVHQRAHAVHAVEEEVRIHLRLQCAQFGVLGAQFQLQRLGLQPVRPPQVGHQHVKNRPHQVHAPPEQQGAGQPGHAVDVAERPDDHVAEILERHLDGAEHEQADGQRFPCHPHVIGNAALEEAPPQVREHQAARHAPVGNRQRAAINAAAGRKGHRHQQQRQEVPARQLQDPVPVRAGGQGASVHVGVFGLFQKGVDAIIHPGRIVEHDEMARVVRHLHLDAGQLPVLRPVHLLELRLGAEVFIGDPAAQNQRGRLDAGDVLAQVLAHHLRHCVGDGGAVRLLAPGVGALHVILPGDHGAQRLQLAGLLAVRILRQDAGAQALRHVLHLRAGNAGHLGGGQRRQAVHHDQAAHLLRVVGCQLQAQETAQAMADYHRLGEMVGGDVGAQLLLRRRQQRRVDGRHAGKAGQGQHVALAVAAVAPDRAVPHGAGRRQAGNQDDGCALAGDLHPEGVGGKGGAGKQQACGGGEYGGNSFHGILRWQVVYR
uniref:Tricorn protease C1 domain-containing protein n=1 Tax=Tanacetum cinerariifolium TaxID=118510 RepID=A0A699GLB7_TANCI|nr:hypothetical protein [Tanacetum cinerariifolium]